MLKKTVNWMRLVKSAPEGEKIICTSQTQISHGEIDNLSMEDDNQAARSNRMMGLSI